MVLKSDIKVRLIQKSDIPSIKKMMEELNLYHGDKSKVSAKQIFDGCFQSKITIGVVMLYKNKFIGFSTGYDWMNFVRASRVHFIDLFFVKEKFRSMGLGQQLLDHVVQAAHKRGCGHIYVGASKFNKNANKFYCDYGFQKQNTQKSNKYILKIEAD